MLGAAYRGGGAKELGETDVIGEEEGATEVMGLDDMVRRIGKGVERVVSGELW